MSSSSQLLRIAESLERLGALARAQSEGTVDFEQLIVEYVSLKKSLARDFQQLAEDDLNADDMALESVRNQLTQRMKELFGGRIPDRYLQVRGYRGVHPILFEYLARHVGSPVPAARLRVLTGDQVHTERRLRELRDLGLDLTSTRVADDDQYLLRSRQPDTDRGACQLAEANIRADSAASPQDKATWLQIIGETQIPTSP
jgi:hypothetical protein